MGSYLIKMTISYMVKWSASCNVFSLPRLIRKLAWSSILTTTQISNPFGNPVFSTDPFKNLWIHSTQNKCYSVVVVKIVEISEKMKY